MDGYLHWIDIDSGEFAAREKVGGKGGGRPDMAMAGGNDPAALPTAFAIVEPWVNQRLAG